MVLEVEEHDIFTFNVYVSQLCYWNRNQLNKTVKPILETRNAIDIFMYMFYSHIGLFIKFLKRYSV